jgi:alpha-1,3-glucan synthase
VLCIRNTFFLQTVENSFIDEDGMSRQAFRNDLMKLNTESSTGELEVEHYLRLCEKRWHNIIWRQKLRECCGAGNTPLLLRLSLAAIQSAVGRHRNRFWPSIEEKSTSLVWQAKEPQPSPIRQLLLYKIGDWPIYTIFLALVC